MLKVNGKAYDWGDVDLKIPGLNIQVQEISYDDELEIEEVYGYPHTMGRVHIAGKQKQLFPLPAVLHPLSL